MMDLPNTEFPHLISFTNIVNERGLLGVLESGEHFGFLAKRFYFLTNVPNGCERGAHAHKKLRQCIFTLKGAVTIDLEKQGRKFSWRLENPSHAINIPPGCWRKLRDFSDDAIVGVIASSPYEEDDYIRNYEEFRQWEIDRCYSVPYLDLARNTEAVRTEIEGAMQSVLDSAMFIGGPAVFAFEREFSGYCGVTHAVGTGNGLDALMLVLRAKQIGPGDSVIVPSLTFIATALAVTQVGAEVIFVDVQFETGNIDPEKLHLAIRSNTKAVIPVHLYGNPADMAPIMDIAKENKLFVIEDAAQAHGALYHGKRCGSLGHAACFSFYPTKNLGALGDGGMVVTNDRDLADSVRSLGNYGSRMKYRHEKLGVNSRLDPLQAAVLQRKLPFLDDWNNRRRFLAHRYIEGLSDIGEIGLPKTTAAAEPVWHIFPIRVKNNKRDELVAHLQQNGVGTHVHYPKPVHLQPAYQSLNLKRGSYPTAELIAEQTLSLPLEPFHAEREIDHIINCIRAYFR